MKRAFILLLVLCMALSLIACGDKKAPAEEPQPATEESTEAEAPEKAPEQAEEPEEAAAEPITITFGCPPAPPTLPILRMMDAKSLGENVDMELDIWTDPETLIAMVQDKDHDIFAFPLTVVAKLANKGMDVRLLNVNTWGVDYFITSDPDFTTWADLKGKTLYIPLQSSPVDALAQYFLNDAGLTPGEDVEIIYGSLPEIATMVGSGQAEYAVLIEPQVSKVLMSNENLRVALSLEEEWQRVTGTESKKPTAGIGTTQHFIDAHPELIEDFQVAYEEAVAWVNENPEEAGKLAEEHLGLKAGLIVKALPNMGLNYKSAVDSKTELNAFYQLLLDFNPAMIGGKLPDDALFYGN